MDFLIFSSSMLAVLICWFIPCFTVHPEQDSHFFLQRCCQVISCSITSPTPQLSSEDWSAGSGKILNTRTEEEGAYWRNFLDNRPAWTAQRAFLSFSWKIGTKVWGFQDFWEAETDELIYKTTPWGQSMSGLAWWDWDQFFWNFWVESPYFIQSQTSTN